MSDPVRLDDAALRERAYRWCGANQTTYSEWTVDELTTAFIALRDATLAEQRTTDLAVLDRHIVIHRSNEARQRAIGNSALAAHNKWCVMVLETAAAAVRGEDLRVREFPRDV